MTRTTLSETSRSETLQMVPGLLGVQAEVVQVAYRGRQVTVIAAAVAAAQAQRPAGADAPITDSLALELLTGAGTDPEWRRPVKLYAVVEARQDSRRAIRAASRWASYAARVALVPIGSLSEEVVCEAALRGIWLITADLAGVTRVAVEGERSATPGSIRGLSHRLLDELVWARLNRTRGASDQSS